MAGRCFMALLSSQDAWEGASEKTTGLRCPSLAAPVRVPATKPKRVLGPMGIAAPGRQDQPPKPDPTRGIFFPLCPPKAFAASG